MKVFFHTRRKLGLEKSGSAKRNAYPLFAMQRMRKSIWASPPRRIAQQTTATRVEMASPGKKQRSPSAAIHTRLSIAGMNAPSAKRPSEFKTPIPNAAPQMKTM